MSSPETPATEGTSNAFVGWLRYAFLRPDYVKQARPKLRGLSRLERRRAKVQYQMHAGAFRTWVYAAALIGFIVVFGLLVMYA
ncbi:hypothetical protein GCM10009765_50130 [Fodinicola feengrottensis]|uniref:Uncharacterized protein n=1 Tax=Fodinicola feengrottensis TaxID=435914 RepID=A0ABN2HWR8_9ACTN